MSSELKQQIEKQISDSPIHIYMKGTPDWPQCGFSKATVDAFRSLGAPFTATNVLEDLDSYRAALMEVTQWPTIPQVFVGGEFIGGCDITLQMLQSGDLQQKIESASQAALAGGTPRGDAGHEGGSSSA